MAQGREEANVNPEDSEERDRPPSDTEEQPTDPDALYSQGMAYYRRRQWHQAKACFEKLHELQPSRRGIEALLHELDIFLQLESVENEANGYAYPDGAGLEAAVAPEQGLKAADRKKHGWLIALLVLVIVVGTVGGVYLYSQGLILTPDRNVQSLRNQCQSYSVAQRYCQALDACSELATTVPDDPEALNGVEKAKSKLYDEALAYVKANAVANALENLQCIYAHDPNYQDVRVMIDQLLVRQDMDRQYQEARGYLDSRAYGEAITRLLKLRTMDANYRPGTLSDDLYEAYMGEGRQWLDLVEAEIKPVADTQPSNPQFAITEDLLTKVRQATKSYERALAERPTSTEAQTAQILAQMLGQGLQHYAARLWDQSARELATIYSKDPTYLAGKAAAVLCDAHLQAGNAQLAGGNYEAALVSYQAMATLNVCDAELVQTKVWEAGAPLTPTATPTFTPTPTDTPTPTQTFTPVPTNTPLPTPTPTPVPTNTPEPPKPKPSNTPVPEPTATPTKYIPPR